MDDARKKAIVGLALATADNFINLLKEDSDSESDEELNFSLMLVQSSLRLRGSNKKPTRNEDYYNVTIPRYTDDQFREHFRITRATFQSVEQRLRSVLSGYESKTGRPRIEVRKQLLSVLWLLSTPDSFRSVGDRFDMGKSILHDCFKRVVRALAAEAHTFIVWPTGPSLERVKAGFARIGVLPNVIGAVDGTFIEIPKPKVDARFYNTRKKFHAVVLQAVCDAELLFTDCHAGYPGSVPDIRVFRNSDLYRAVNENLRHYFPADEYIIGDKAYPLLSWCIPPFINRGVLTELQERFNTALCSERQVIERALALLKGRFRRLKYLDMLRIDLVPETILACCVLHNICLLGKDENNQEFIREGEIDNNNHNVCENNEPVQEVTYDPAGEVKRAHLVNFVAQQMVL